jgi:M6 family metalloprotease-like protein
MKRKEILFLLFGVFTVRVLYGIPAFPEGIWVRQPDGEKFQLFLRGDEYYSWYEDKNGFTVMKDEKTGIWYYAERGPDGILIPGKIKVGKGSPWVKGIKPYLRDQQKVLLAQRRKREIQASPPSFGPPRRGVLKNLVLLVQFPDYQGTYTKADFEALFNTEGYNIDGAKGSVKDYFKEISYNQLEIQSTVTDWITVEHGYAYYGANQGNRIDVRVPEMVNEALRKLEIRGFDFSNFDANNDGWVDGLTVIHAGFDEAYQNNSNWMWSHFGRTSRMILDGKILRDYHTESEKRGNEHFPSTWGLLRIGVVCHEMLHFLGLPDLYDYEGDSRGVGDFCVMGYGAWGEGGVSPVHLSAWGKIIFRWLTPQVIRNRGQYSLHQIETLPGSNIPLCYRLIFPGPEYFLLENRRGEGFDRSLPGPKRGMLIWHIDQTRQDNNDQTHYMVDVEEASGIQHLQANLNDGNDADYYRLGDNSFFGTTSVPNNLKYNGEPCPWNVVNISAPGAIMTFTILSKDDPPAVPILISPPDGALIEDFRRVRLKWSGTVGGRGKYTLKWGPAGEERVVENISQTMYLLEENLASSTTYYWQVEAIEEDGKKSGFQPTPYQFTTGALSVNPNLEEISGENGLLVSYPNPFNPECYILVERIKHEPGRRKVKIYNILGQLVRKIECSRVQGVKGGVYWDGRDSRGLEVPAGVYFYEVDGEGVRRIIVLK